LNTRKSLVLYLHVIRHLCRIIVDAIDVGSHNLLPTELLFNVFRLQLEP